MSDELTQRIRDLEAKAEYLHSIRQQASRAFVVEFAGTPKSGKSTSVEAIRHFFKRSKFGVHVLTERASQCPIPMKGHLFFNTWCATTMLAQLLENVETNTDIIIADRGLFDSLIWFQTQFRRGELSSDELQNIENFLLMDRWKDLFDLVVVLHSDASTALSRENAHRITERPGSIMNQSTLDVLSSAVQAAEQRYGQRFTDIVTKSTVGGDVRMVNVCLLEQILHRFESFLNPEILTVPKARLQTLLAKAPCSFVPSPETTDILRIIEREGRYTKRDEAESDSELVQVVPCGVLLRSGRVFLFQRRDQNPKSNLYGKSTVWQGCHVVRASSGNGEQLSQVTLEALQRRVAQSLFIGRRELKADFVGYTWDTSDKGDGKHLGLTFRLNIESMELADSLKNKEFRRSRGHSLGGDFWSPDELVARADEFDLEPWSRAILSENGQKGLYHVAS